MRWRHSWARRAEPLLDRLYDCPLRDPGMCGDDPDGERHRFHVIYAEMRLQQQAGLDETCLLCVFEADDSLAALQDEWSVLSDP